MTRREVRPFMDELRETVTTARYRFEELAKAAEQWKAHDASTDALMAVHPNEFDDERFTSELSGATRQQLAMFEALEAFLAAWARVSLLLFPTHGNKARGQALRDALALASYAPLDDRDCATRGCTSTSAWTPP